MLLNLNIKNYVLIDQLGLEFGEGLNIFTGETGAGKSIIIESVGLALGGRAGAGIVKSGAERCFIGAQFDISGYTALNNFLAESGLSGDDGMLLIRREIDLNGKNRAFVNDKPASVSILALIGDYLVDVHGQHEHQTLLKGSVQRELLDRFARNEKLLEETAEVFDTWSALTAQKEARRISEEERTRLVDLYGFQLKEIDSLKPVPGEEEELEQKLPMLKNAEKLQALSSQACALLYGEENSALERIGKTQKLVDSINSISESLAGPSETLKNASSLVDDALRELERFRDSLSADPETLNALLTRQDLLHKLKRKYAKDIPEILAYRGKICQELETLNNADKNLKELEDKIRKSETTLRSLCEKLTASRKKAANKLSEGVEKELSVLGMKKAAFSAGIEKETNPSKHGWDNISFLFSANAGEGLKPLKDIASGGEMIAPSTNPLGQGRCNRYLARPATMVVVNSTRPMASSEMGRRFARKSRHDVNIAAGNNSGGSTTRKTNSGFSRTLGNPGTKPSNVPPITKKMGYGRWNRRATNASTTTANNIPTKSSTVKIISSPSAPHL